MDDYPLRSNDVNNEVFNVGKTSGLFDKLKSGNSSLVINRTSKTVNNDSVFKMPRRLVEAEFNYCNIDVRLQKAINSFKKSLSLANLMVNGKEEKLISLYTDLTMVVMDMVELGNEQVMNCTCSSTLNGTAHVECTISENCSRTDVQMRPPNPLVHKHGETIQLRDQSSTSSHGFLNNGLAIPISNPSLFKENCSILSVQNHRNRLSLDNGQSNDTTGVRTEKMNFQLAFDAYVNAKLGRKLPPVPSMTLRKETPNFGSPILRSTARMLRNETMVGSDSPDLSVTRNSLDTEKNNVKRNKKIDLCSSALFNESSMKQNSKPNESITHKKSSNITSKDLTNWYIMKIPGSRNIELHGCVAFPNGKMGVSDQFGVVYARVSNNFLKTSKGSFVLSGKMLPKKGVPREIYKTFQYGFPIHWRKAIQFSWE